MKEDCIFCNIISGGIPCKKVYEDELVFAFHDINPIAPVHILIIPKQHIESTNALDGENSAIVQDIFLAVKHIANEVGLSESGYRVITNCGEDGGQTVKHLHFHLLGGAKLPWQ